MVTTNLLAPGVHVIEEPGGARPIQAVGTSTAGFVGVAPNPNTPTDRAFAINNWSQFRAAFVGETQESTPLSRPLGLLPERRPALLCRQRRRRPADRRRR